MARQKQKLNITNKQNIKRKLNIKHTKNKTLRNADMKKAGNYVFRASLYLSLVAPPLKFCQKLSTRQEFDSSTSSSIRLFGKESKGLKVDVHLSKKNTKKINT